MKNYYFSKIIVVFQDICPVWGSTCKVINPSRFPRKTEDLINLVALRDSNKGELKKIVVHNWDSDIEDWTFISGKEYEKSIKGIRQIPINETLIKPEERKGHGKGVLSINATLEPSNFEKIAVNLKKDSNWEKILLIEYELYIPENSITTLEAVPFVQSENWKNWSQDEGSALKLQPGKWVKIKFTPKTLSNLNTSDVNAYGTFIWGQIKKEYNGPIYLDNWTIYLKGDNYK